MKIVIAEKPSAAMDILKAIGKIDNVKFERKNGFFESNSVIVTWCVGHLVGLALPTAYKEEYGWGKWDLKLLPMIPKEWKYEIKPATKKQFNVIRKIVKKHKKAVIINACDAGREGELIFLLVVNKLGVYQDRKLERLWLNSFVFEDIKKAWQNLLSFEDKVDLGASALARAKADWILGMNLSMYYGLTKNITGLSIGRVKTPTLALVVERNLDILNWKDRKEYKLVLKHKETDFVFYNLSDEGKTKSRQFANRAILEGLVAKIENKTGFVSEVVKKDKIEYHPKPFDLTRLQRQANKQFKFTAKKTLEITQKLYEAKLVTYPRTDSDYLPESMLPECQQTLEVHLDTKKFSNYLDSNMDKKPIFNSKKVTDHYAIIPTKNVMNKENYSDEEVNLYSLIKSYFVFHFLKPHLYSETINTINCQGYLFESANKLTTQMGYKDLMGQKGHSGPSQDFQQLINEKFPVKSENLSISDVKISKPKPHTESTLLLAMQRCGNDLEEEAREILKGRGIGTPATRASMIEELVKKEYIERKKNYLYPTDLGLKIIKFVNPQISSAKMTGDWELKLHGIENGKYNAYEYLDEINGLIKTIINQGAITGQN